MKRLATDNDIIVSMLVRTKPIGLKNIYRNRCLRTTILAIKLPSKEQNFQRIFLTYHHYLMSNVYYLLIEYWLK